MLFLCIFPQICRSCRWYWMAGYCFNFTVKVFLHLNSRVWIFQYLVHGGHCCAPVTIRHHRHRNRNHHHCHHFQHHRRLSSVYDGISYIMYCVFGSVVYGSEVWALDAVVVCFLLIKAAIHYTLQQRRGILVSLGECANTVNFLVHRVTKFTLRYYEGDMI